MANPEEQNSQLCKYEPAPAALPKQESKPVTVQKRKILTCSILASGGALLAATILLGIYHLCRWQCCTHEKILVLGKIQCNRATSSNQLYEALKAAPRSSWPPITTINGRQYACISTYKVDVTHLGNP